MKPKRSLIGCLLAALSLSLVAPLSQAKPPVASDPQSVVDAAYGKFKDLKEGENADYIPVLAKVDPNLFGIPLVTVDGKVHTAGDISTEVSIQSISKVFTMAQIIQEQGPESIAISAAALRAIRKEAQSDLPLLAIPCSRPLAISYSRHGASPGRHDDIGGPRATEIVAMW